LGKKRVRVEAVNEGKLGERWHQLNLPISGCCKARHAEGETNWCRTEMGERKKEMGRG
jgi:hypothetical protein